MDEETRTLYPADENLIELAAECRQQWEQSNLRLGGAIALYVRQHKLPGIWRIAENGRELERVDRTPAATNEVPSKKRKEKNNERSEQLLGVEPGSGPGGVPENSVPRD